MDFLFNSILFAGAMFLAMLLFVEIGHRWGVRERVKGEPRETGVIDAALFALLGLLVAFTFSGAADRFDKRRALIVDEANAIGTAYLRLSLLAPTPRDELKEQFRRYVDERLAIYRALPDVRAALRNLDAANALQLEIWDRAVAATQDSSSTRMLLLPALNEMIDITTTRTMSARTHPPLVVFGLLFGLALLSALVAGRAMASREGRPWLQSLLYAFAMAGAVYVIVDMEYPRVGLIRVDAFDNVLVDLRQSMR